MGLANEPAARCSICAASSAPAAPDVPGSDAPTPRGHRTRCDEPDLTLFSGAATLIQPCSQVGSGPDPPLFPACGEPDPALFFGRSGSPPLWRLCKRLGHVALQNPFSSIRWVSTKPIRE